MLKYRLGLIILFSLIILSAVKAIPIEISDQGTDVKEASTGNKLVLANLTVEIWNAASGGAKIWNQTFANAITNGSWNVMLGETVQLDLEFGEKYWKNYIVNTDDINFTNRTGSNADRLEFYSPLGVIEREYVNFTSLNISGAVKISGNLNMSGYNITSVNTISNAGASITFTDDLSIRSNMTILGNLNVTGTSYLGSVTLNAENITLANLIARNNAFVSIGNTSTTQLFINGTTGNVGIRTTSPSQKLHVTSATNLDGLTVETTGDTAPGVRLLAGSTNAASRNWGFSTNYGNFGDFVIRESTARLGDPISVGSTRLTILSGGNVGIGTTSPSYKLDVNGNVRLNNTLYINETGKVGIGTSNPANTLNVVGDLNVTGTSYLGSVTLTADNITVSKIMPEPGNENNLTIYNATGSTIAKFKGDGKLEVWNPAEGAGDYVSIYHDGTTGYLSTASGDMYLLPFSDVIYADSILSTAANARQIGNALTEWKSLYLGEDAVSGAYFGLDQDWRLNYDEALDDKLILNGTNVFEIINATSGQSIFRVNANNTRIGIGTANPTHTLHVAGDLNVSGVAYLGNSKLAVGNITTAQLEVTSDIKLRNNSELIFGSENYTALDWSTAQATAPTLLWGFATNAGGGAGSGGNSLIITTETNKDQNFQHPSQTNPTIFVQSAETPASSTTKWGLVTHDNTTMLIDAGDNMITLNDNTTIKGDLVVGEEGLGNLLVDMYDNSTEFVIEAVHNVSFKTAKMVSADNVFRLVPIAGGTHPVTCDASSRGGLFVNNTGKDLCICGDSGWMFVSNRSGC